MSKHDYSLIGFGRWRWRWRRRDELKGGCLRGSIAFSSGRTGKSSGACGLEKTLFANEAKVLRAE
jgi:hypothetical protein